MVSERCTVSSDLWFLLECLFMERQEPGRNEALLGLAAKRIPSITKILSDNKVYVPRNGVVSRMTLVAGVYSFDRQSSLEGIDNLREVRKLHDAGGSVIQIRNHFSDLDHGVVSSMLSRHGFDDLVENWVLAAGLKMDERVLARGPSFSENRLRIPTPFDNSDVVSALDDPSHYSSGEIETLLLLQKKYKELGLRALREAGRRIYGQGMDMVLYPEATRSRSGLLGRGHRDTSLWFRFLAKRGNLHILPVGVEGAEQIAPPGALRPFTRVSARANVGELFPAEKVIEFADRSPDPDQTIADVVMAHVAVLLDRRYVLPNDLAKAVELKDCFESFRPTA